MPVSCPIQFTLLSDEEFHRLDYQVMRHVFDCHNELGRLCDEAIYHSDLAARLAAANLGPIQTEVPLTVSWREFRKTYFLDLVVGATALYELKVVSMLLGEHQSQILNYVLLLELRTAKLVNLRSPKVESRFMSSRLTSEMRRDISFDTARFQPVSDGCAAFRRDAEDLLRTLGAFLALDLYEEALVWACGGELKAIQSVEMSRAGIVLGRQRCNVVAPGVAFRVTAYTDSLDRVESHLTRFLRHANLRALHWLNLDRSTITLTTLLPSA